MARPTKLTPALHAAIVEAVRDGLGYHQAAGLAGVSKTSADEWRRRGEGRDSRPTSTRYAAFASDLQKAESVDEARRLAAITAAGEGGVILYERTRTYQDGSVEHEVKYTRPEWTAHAWVLERKYPDRWGRRERVDMRLQIERAAAVVAEELGITPEEVIAEAQRLLKESDERP